jgi:hypothetical protein
MVAIKLGYEWKNVYRILTHQDETNSGICSLKFFDSLCQKHNISLTKNDLKKLMQMFGELDQNNTNKDGSSYDLQQINFRKLSVQLGLHKESYNYLKKTQISNKTKNIEKMKQLFNSIDRKNDIKDTMNIQNK